MFIVCARASWLSRHDDSGRGLAQLISSALFAALFEALNVRQLSGRGSYFYDDKFLLYIDRVPLFIILAWALILWGAMHISDAAPISEAARVGCDAIFAVMLDLGFDVTAIRHEFWTWRGVAFDQAWFGVPAGNFFGWLWVSLAFSALTRALWLWKPRSVLWWQLFAVPPLGFLLYRTIESGTNHLLVALNWTGDRTALMAFFAVFTLISVVLAVTPKKQSVTLSPRRLPHSTRAAFHAFAVCGLFALPAGAPGTAQRMVLLPLALAILTLEVLWQRSMQKTGTKHYGTE
jgi:hypothetical protein